MFVLPDSWVWDFWFADDGEQHHLFFLYASRALHEPDARHYRASIGHAVSDDLVSWTRVADVLVRSDAPAWDDLATWTGSVVRHPDGTWFLFYTGATLTPAGNVQRIGYATSSDLMTWHKAPENPVLEADPRWYETLADGQWHDEAFRDPWVLPDPDGDGWHMLITARARTGPADDRGVVGHAWSPDLRTWELRPPLTEPGQGFGQLEVMQVEVVDGVPVLLFSCMAGDMAADRAQRTTGGVWVAPAASVLGPFDVAAAQQVTDSSLYSG
ncbi:glycosyl hydrolase family 32, partial [Streptomyces griseoincarnatus]